MTPWSHASDQSWIHQYPENYYSCSPSTIHHEALNPCVCERSCSRSIGHDAVDSFTFFCCLIFLELMKSGSHTIRQTGDWRNLRNKFVSSAEKLCQRVSDICLVATPTQQGIVFVQWPLSTQDPPRLIFLSCMESAADSFL